LSEAVQGKYVVAVIGAGPAGLFASKILALNGVHVVLLNRDILPGGLAEYGIYYDKFKMKEGLRKQFQQILNLAQIDYYGNITVGETGDISLPELRALGFQAVMVKFCGHCGWSAARIIGVYHVTTWCSLQFTATTAPGIISMGINWRRECNAGYRPLVDPRPQGGRGDFSCTQRP
jgi:hypothetical protein